MDALWNKRVDEFRSHMKAQECCALLNTAADLFCNKPRFYLQLWNEATNTIVPEIQA